MFHGICEQSGGEPFRPLEAVSRYLDRHRLEADREGGPAAPPTADVGLLDEVIVSIAPVTLGGGAALLPRRIELHLDEFGRNGDFACARFSVVRPPA